MLIKISENHKALWISICVQIRFVLLVCFVFSVKNSFAFTIHNTGSFIRDTAYRPIQIDDKRVVEVLNGFEVIRPVFKSGDDLVPLPESFSFGEATVLKDGRLLLIYPNINKLEASFSSDGGSTWTKPEVITDGTHRAAVLQTKNGTIWAIFFRVVSYDETKAGSKSDLFAVSSTDGGKTWSNPQTIWKGYTGMTQGMIETRKGTIVMPFCYIEERTRWIGACVYSQDQGKTWQYTQGIDIGPETDSAQRRNYPADGGSLEPSIVQLKDGRLFMVMRTIVGKLYHCYSSDDGVTWSKPLPMKLTCGGPVYITRLKSKRLAMVWNEADWNNPDAKRLGFPYGFARASISVSEDEGDTWSQPIVFAQKIRSVHSLVSNSGRRGELLLTMPQKPIFLKCKEKLLLKSSKKISRL